MKINVMKKNIIALLLIAAMVFTFAACGKQPEASGGTTLSTGDTGSTNDNESTDESADSAENTDEEDSQEVTDSITGEPIGDSQEDIPVSNGAIPQGTRAPSSYFDDVVFVGDSVSLKLSYYEAAMDVLGDAQFLTSGSLGSGNALWEVSDESVHPVYNGQKTLIEESVASMNAGKIYIMLGMNDLGLYGIDGAITNLKTLVNRIQQNAPQAKIYIQSMTPTTSTSTLLSSSAYQPENIRAYNQKLLSTCIEQGWYYVDVASVMYDSNGYLIRDYCSDPDGMGIHFTNTGCAAWVEYLYTHTAG